MTYRAKKSLGQNFLKSEIALKKIAEAGEIKSTDIILEIGPGRGALTEKLLGSRCKVLAVEKDRELYEFLKTKFAKEISSGQFNLINGDILEFDTRTYNLDTRTYKVIANIPYNITGAILKKFLTEKNQPERMVLLVQREVAKRIMARDNKESILSISVKAYGSPEMIMKVEARYFSPKPKVDSAVIAIKNISRRIFSAKGGSASGGEDTGVDEEKFWEIVKTGFAHKRKKLSSNLNSLKNLENNKEELAKNLKNKRAEDLALSDWILLAKLSTKS